MPVFPGTFARHTSNAEVSRHRNISRNSAPQMHNASIVCNVHKWYRLQPSRVLNSFNTSTIACFEVSARRFEGLTLGRRGNFFDYISQQWSLDIFSGAVTTPYYKTFWPKLGKGLTHDCSPRSTRCWQRNYLEPVKAS